MAEKVIPPCEVCKHNVQQCEDCEQYLCSSCRTRHNSLNGCKGHVGADVKEFLETRRGDNCGYNDACIHHPRTKARCYCNDCKEAVCADCFIRNHSGHSHLDLQNNDMRKKERKELENLNQDLETEMIRHQHYLDLLKSLITDITNSSAAVRDSIDKQVDRICCQIKKLGEEIKEENEKKLIEEKEKLRKFVEDGEILLEDLKASIKYTGNILEDKLMVQVIERKVKVEKEKMAAMERKLDIPDVKYPWFEEGEINEHELLEQLGELMMKKGPTFTTSFNFDDEDLQSGVTYYGDDYNICGLSWYVGVRKIYMYNQDTLIIYLHLKSSVKSCDVKYSLKLINNKNIKKSVERRIEHVTFTDDGLGWGRLFITWDEFSNKQNGFLTDDNKFTVQATVKVLKIEH